MLHFIDLRENGSGGSSETIYFDSVRATDPIYYRYKPLLEPYQLYFWTCMAHYAVVF